LSRTAAVALALLVPSLLSACVQASSRAGDPATITGFVRLYGGPASPTTGQGVLTGAPTPGQVVHASQDGKAVATATSGADGRFTLTVPQGSYTLDCSDTNGVTVGAGTVAHVDCGRAVP
jgi:hypothetical protein